MKASYQQGSLERRARAKGPDVWLYRFRQQGRYRGQIIGTVEEFPTEAAAWRECDSIRRTINGASQIPSRLFSEVIKQYALTEMSQRFSTKKANNVWLYNYIEPEFGAKPVQSIEALEVRYWLERLTLAAKSKSHIRSLMFQLFETAMLHKFIEPRRNPIELVKVKGATKRQKAPRVLTDAEIRRVFEVVNQQPLYTMVLCAACFGLRCSELFALKWGDFDWKKSELQLARAIVQGRVDGLKTEESAKPMPVDDELADRILAWKKLSEFKSDSDWVFASPYKAGEMPYCGRGILELQLKPKFKAAGLGEIGWHTFRHTYRRLVSSSGATLDVQRGLMRHSSIQTTMNVYGGAVADDKRDAHGKVVRMVLKQA